MSVVSMIVEFGWMALVLVALACADSAGRQAGSLLVLLQAQIQQAEYSDHSANMGCAHR